MIFERGTDKDVPEIHTLVEMCYRGEFAKNGWTYESDILGGVRCTEEYIREEMNAPGGSFTIHRDEHGKLIGCVYSRAFPEERHMHVGMLCVYPLLQSKGLGKKLMIATEELAKQEGCSKLRIQVITIRKELIDWYERLGFKDSGETLPFVSRNGAIGTPKVSLEFGIWEKVLE